MADPPNDSIRSPDGTQWWDGTIWQPVSVDAVTMPADAVRSELQAEPIVARTKKDWWRRWWFRWGLAVLAAIVLGIPTAGIVTAIVILFVFPAMAVMEVLRAGGRTKVGREIGSAVERSAQRASERRQAESYPRLANAVGAKGVRVKSYKSNSAFQSDADKMMRAGWRMEGQVAQGGHVSVGKTLLKGNLTLGLGYLTGFSRTKDKITVTWVR